MLRSLHAIVPSASFLVQIVGICLSVVALMIYSPYSNDHYALPPVHIGMHSLRYLDISSLHINVLEAIAAPYLQSLELRGYAPQSSVLSFRSVFTEVIQWSNCSNSSTTLNLYRTCDCRDLITMFSHMSSIPRYTDLNRSKFVVVVYVGCDVDWLMRVVGRQESCSQESGCSRQYLDKCIQ